MSGWQFYVDRALILSFSLISFMTLSRYSLYYWYSISDMDTENDVYDNVTGLNEMKM